MSKRALSQDEAAKGARRTICTPLCGKVFPCGFPWPYPAACAPVAQSACAPFCQFAPELSHFDDALRGRGDGSCRSSVACCRGRAALRRRFYGDRAGDCGGDLEPPTALTRGRLSLGVVGEDRREPPLRLLKTHALPARIVFNLILRDLADAEIKRLRVTEIQPAH